MLLAHASLALFKDVAEASHRTLHNATTLPPRGISETMLSMRDLGTRQPAGNGLTVSYTVVLQCPQI